MEQATGGVEQGVRARHHQARSRAFAARTAVAGERYETPSWLERSFVLPVDADDVPDQPVAVHDDLDVSAHVLDFIRPETPEIDFAAVVRREDATRLGRRTAVGAFVLALLTALSSLLVPSTVIMPAALCLALVGVAATVWVTSQSRAPIPLRA